MRSGVDMLRYLIETHQKTQRGVAGGTEHAESTISEILAGKRKLGVKHAEALTRFLRSTPRFFLMGGEGRPQTWQVELSVQAPEVR